MTHDAERDPEELERRVRDAYAGFGPAPGAWADLERRLDAAESRRVERRPWRYALAALVALLLLWGAVELGRRSERTDGGGRPLAPAPTDLSKARAEDQAAWTSMRDALHREHDGEWAVIADGRLQTTGKSLAGVVGAAPGAIHRFVFRVGEDGDQEALATQWYAPRFSGGALVAALGLGVSFGSGHGTMKLSKDGEEVTFEGAPPFSRIHLRVERADAPPDAETPPLEVFLGTVGPALVLTPEDAERMGLARFEVPGTLTLAKVWPLRRVLVRVAVPGLPGDAVIVAGVPTMPRETLVDLARARDMFWTWGGNLPDHVVKGREGKWIVFGVDRVLGEGASPAEALRAAEGATDFTYHRYVMKLPREGPLVLDVHDFWGRLPKVPDEPVPGPMFEKPVTLDGHEVRGFPDAKGERWLLRKSAAEGLGLEHSEEGRDVFLEKPDGRKAARAAYAWRGDPRTSKETVLVVWPLE